MQSAVNTLNQHPLILKACCNVSQSTVPSLLSDPALGRWPAFSSTPTWAQVSHVHPHPYPNPTPLPVQVPVSAKGVGEWRGTLADPVSWHSHWFNGISWVMQTLCLFLTPGPFFSPKRLVSANVHGVEGSTVEWSGQLGRPGWVIPRMQSQQINKGAQVWAIKQLHLSQLSCITITVIPTIHQSWFLDVADMY